jgi:AraC-like DNA-binding protein
MTYYTKILQRLKETWFSNQGQIEAVVTAKKYLDTHFQETIDLDRLARISGTSKYHLLRLFKHYFGITPRQYLINKRIEAAKNLLRKGTSVADTCYAIGFESVHSFSRLFKAKTGMPPSAYKRATFDTSNP